MLKLCSKCHTHKDTGDFSPRKSACKLCRRQEQKIYALNNKAAVRTTEKKKQIRNRNFIYNSKLNKRCIDCDIIYDPSVLHFDHITNNKTMGISKMITNSSIKRIQEEMNKCEIVCSNCHRERTHNRSVHQNVNKKSKTPTRDKLFLIVNKIKESSSCMDCDQSYHSYQMDFDHRDQTLKINGITDMIVSQQSIEIIMSEIDKCDLICANCHAMRSSIQLNYKKYITTV